MHRKGMVKDTVHTDVIDEKYAEGLQLLENRRYKDALEICLTMMMSTLLSAIYPWVTTLRL